MKEHEVIYTLVKPVRVLKEKEVKQFGERFAQDATSRFGGVG